MQVHIPKQAWLLIYEGPCQLDTLLHLGRQQPFFIGFTEECKALLTFSDLSYTR